MPEAVFYNPMCNFNNLSTGKTLKCAVYMMQWPCSLNGYHCVFPQALLVTASHFLFSQMISTWIMLSERDDYNICSYDTKISLCVLVLTAEKCRNCCSRFYSRIGFVCGYSIREESFRDRRRVFLGTYGRGRALKMEMGWMFVGTRWFVYTDVDHPWSIWSEISMEKTVRCSACKINILMNSDLMDIKSAHTHTPPFL